MTDQELTIQYPIADESTVVQEMDRLLSRMHEIRGLAEKEFPDVRFVWVVRASERPGECILRLEEIERGMNE